MPMSTAAKDPKASAESAVPAAAASVEFRERLLTGARDMGVVGVVVALMVVLSLSSSSFLTSTNLQNIFDQWAELGIVACAGTLVIIAGGFDLSVASIYAVSAVLAAKLTGSMGIVPAFVIACAAGAFLGLVNALLVSIVRINAVIATLASGIVFGGIALRLSGGNLVTSEVSGFTDLATTKLFGVTLPVYFYFAIAIVLAILLHRSIFGRYVYASGGNPEAARMSGVSVARVQSLTYVLSGLAAGFGGVLAASKFGSGQAEMAPGLEFDAIAAIVVGGTSILGGSGAIWRTVVGVFLLGLVQNGSNLLNIEATYQDVIYGGIIIIAAGADVWVRRRAGAR
jgi:ribose transport system permease protein